MKRIPILLSVCLMLAAQAFCQDTVKLEYKYTPNELLRYKMVISANLQLAVPNGQAMTIPMRMVGLVKQRTKRVLPDGSAELAVAFESMRAQVGDQIHEMPAKQVPVMTIVVSKSGQIQKASCPGMDSAGLMTQQMLNTGGFGHYAVLPTTDLRVGDTWSQDIPEMPGIGSVRETGKLISTNSKVGKYKTAAFRQSVGGNLNLDSGSALPLRGSPPIPPGMKMNGAFLGDGTVYFSVERGQLIRTDGRLDLQVNVNVPQINGRQVGNATANMAMTYEMFLISADKAK